MHVCTCVFSTSNNTYSRCKFCLGFLSLLLKDLQQQINEKKRVSVWVLTKMYFSESVDESFLLVWTAWDYEIN